MDWLNFNEFALVSTISWVLGLLFVVLKRNSKTTNAIGNAFIIIGIAAISVFIVFFWIKLERPPMRTKGETRLWYSLFLSLVGMVVYIRWKKKWHWLVSMAFLFLSIFMAILFLYLNYKNPENFDKTLMPALQSPWFVPHVVVYIFSYALLGLSTVVAIIGLFQYYLRTHQEMVLRLADNLVYIGFAFLTFGLLFGALWAKVAWGHYWTWDPKETWAFVTWLMYLIYIHYRFHKPKNVRLPLWTLSLAFVILLVAWFGINYLPSAQNSVHVYGN